MRQFPIRYTYRLLPVLLAALLCSVVCEAQRGKDTINLTSTCLNATITFGSPVFDSLFSPTSIHWNFGDPSSGYYDSSAAQQPKHIFSTPGQYFISLVVVNNQTDTVRILDTVNIVTPMAYNFGPDIYLCQGQDTLLMAPVAPGALYAWNDVDTTHTDTLRVAKSGVYTVSINGCGIPDSIGVFISTTPQLDLGKDHVMCDSANLVLNAATQNGQYTWLLNGNTLTFQGDQLLTEYPGGTYIAIVTVPGCGVYKDTVSITYSAPLAPAFDLGPDTLLCPKQIYTLNAAMTGATAYDWSTGAADSLIRISQPGTYWVFVTVGNICQVTDTVLVTYRGDRALDFHDTAICQGSTLTLDADFGTGQYNWQSVPPQRDDQNQTGQATYYVYRPGTYSITAAVGQCVYKDTLTVSFDDSLRVSMPGDTTLCNGEDFLLQVKGNADSYAWQDSSYASVYHVTQSGVYTVVAQNNCGKDTLTTKVSLTACACQLLLPNAFTPNAGSNETFRPLHACEMSAFQLAVFDRVGDMVFRTENPEQGWDGTFRGERVSAGTYVWMVRYISTTTKQAVLRKGTVMVVR